MSEIKVFVCLCVFFCLDNDKTANAKCSPRWIVYPHSYSKYVSPVSGVTTQNQCLDACVANSSCVAATWWSIAFKRSDGHWRCQLLNNGSFFQHHRRRYGVITFKLVRQCTDTTGRPTLNHTALLQLKFWVGLGYVIGSVS